MSTSQISNLRTGKLYKPGPQTWFALGEANLRIAQAVTMLDRLPAFGTRRVLGIYAKRPPSATCTKR